MAIRDLISLLSVFFMSGCIVVDEDYHLQRSFSAALEIRNDTDLPLMLTSIHQSADSHAVFEVKLSTVEKAKTLKDDIQADTYEAIEAGRFILNGSCGDIETWAINGSEGVNARLLTIDAVESEWKVRVVVNKCR